MKIEHYTPSELLDLYPDAKKLGWTPVKIGMMFRCGLLVGFFSGKESSAMILEESFKDLLRYMNQVNRSRDFNIDE